ncbi:biliverdin-producing heme oxygenase [Ferruginibacter sp.]
MIIDTLRTATKKAHQDLDHYIFPIIRKIDDNEEYAKLLKVFFGYFKPVYNQLDKYLTDDNVQLYSSRRKPERIIEDLTALGMQEEGFLLCDSCPLIDTTAKAFGAFYVLEGSTMGGNIIVRNLMGQLKKAPPASFSFFSGYADQNLQMWNFFLTDLENNTQPAAVDELVHTASATFLTFANWIKNNYESAD